MSGIKRADRVAGEISATLSQILLEGVRDPRVRNITITSVRVADDLRLARVNFVPLAGQGDSSEILDGLHSAAGYLRGELGRRLQLRYVPELRFHLDENLDRAMNITDLIDRLAEERGEREGGEGEDAEGAEEDADGAEPTWGEDDETEELS